MRAEIGGPRQRALLALLLIEANRVVPLDRLVDALWEEDPPATARHAVRVYASNLRKSIGGGIHGQGGGYVLEADAEAIDAKRFERLVDEGRRLLSAESVVQARETFEQALALWRGPPLTEFEGEQWAELEVGRLEEFRLADLEARIDADLELGRHQELVVELEALVAEHPMRERLSAQLMRALYRGGRQADALAVYRKTRSLLVDELGLEPGPDLRRLERAILDQDPALVVEPAEQRERRRLPEPATPLVGRRTEIEGVAGLLRGDARLVTVIGPGGIGKTRVALEAARELAGAFRHGVFFVGLSAVRDPELVPAEIASAVGVEDTNGALVEHLRTRDLLLLADNFEQVDDAAPLLGSLLQEASGLKVLITSRHALRLYGEHRFSLPPLTLDREAVPLFLQRARAAGRAVDVDDSVREICRRLDCLPLAIELAAARVAEYKPKELLALLPRSLDLATEGPRDVPERQRTL